jgi:hypothetical protein
VTEVELGGFIDKKIGDGKRAETSLNQRPRCGGTGVDLHESSFIKTSALLVGWSAAFKIWMLCAALPRQNRPVKPSLYIGTSALTAAGWEGNPTRRLSESCVHLYWFRSDEMASTEVITNLRQTPHDASLWRCTGNFASIATTIRTDNFRSSE